MAKKRKKEDDKKHTVAFIPLSDCPSTTSRFFFNKNKRKFL